MGEEAQEARSRRTEFDLHDRDLNCTCVCLEMQNESELAYMAHEGHAAGRVSSVLRPYQGHDMIAKSVGKGAKEGDTNHITQPSDVECDIRMLFMQIKCEENVRRWRRCEWKTRTAH